MTSNVHTDPAEQVLPKSTMKVEEVEVSKRDVYYHDIDIQEVGSTLIWRFSTHRKKIGFGLIYRPDKSIQHKLLPEQYEGVFSSLGPNELFIHPPSKSKPRKSNSTDMLLLYDSSSSLNSVDLRNDSTAITKKSNAIKRISKYTSLKSQSSEKDQKILASQTEPGSDTLLDSSHHGICIKVLPVAKYNSYKFEIYGQLLIPLPGLYTLIFDNSFSVSTAKRLYFSYHLTPCTMPQYLGSALLSHLPSVASSSEPLIGTSGWILKRKRKNMSGWTKKWAVLNQGILSLYDAPDGNLLIVMNMLESTVAKIQKSRKIIFDSGRNILYVKALTASDFDRWMSAIVMFKKCSEPNLQDMKHTSQKAAEIMGLLDISKANLQESMLILGRAISTGKFFADDARCLNILLARIQGSIEAARSEMPQEDGHFVEDSRIGSLSISVPRSATKSISSSAASPFSGGIEDDEFFDAGDVIDLSDYEDSEDDRYLAAQVSPTFLNLDSREEVDEFNDDDEEEEEEDEDREDSLLMDHHISQIAALPLVGRDILVPISGEILAKLSEHQTLPWPYRTTLPATTAPITVSISSLLRKSIGKDSSSLSMPICLNEPVNMLQRLCQELEYAELLSIAASLSDNPIHRLVMVTAFACSSYAYTLSRAERKPFSPLLGETFEYISAAKDFRFIAEKVAHHPPVLACHAEGGHSLRLSRKNDRNQSAAWEYFQDVRVKSKFWGKSVEFTPAGIVSVRLLTTNELFTWTKVTSSIHNVLGTTPWPEHYGEFAVKNHSTGDVCHVVFKRERGFFASSSENEVSGSVHTAISANKEPPLHVKGRWHERLHAVGSHPVYDSSHPVSKAENHLASSVMSTESLHLLDSKKIHPITAHSQLLWQNTSSISLSPKEYYGFNAFAMSLNELKDDLKPYLPRTDTRWRPDQRLYEQGLVAEAEPEKLRLEDIQRQRRKNHDTEEQPWRPNWFFRNVNPTTGDESWLYSGGYWEHRNNRAFPSSLPNLW